MAKAEKAKRAGKKRADAPKAEPFFRPFEKLAADKKKKAPKKDEPPTEPLSTAKRAPKTAPPKAAPPKPAPRDPEAIQMVDPDTFALYMAGVRALADRPGRIPTTASRLERAARTALPIEDPDADARARMRALVIEGIRFETLDDGDCLEGRRLDVDPRELRRLRRGQYAIDGKLDLHGLGVAEARSAVETFVKKRAVAGDRVVIIVVGKGTHSPRGVSVLRGEIAAWLSQGRAARHTAAFATAPDEQGGAGAVLVLLAR